MNTIKNFILNGLDKYGHIQLKYKVMCSYGLFFTRYIFKEAENGQYNG